MKEVLVAPYEHWLEVQKKAQDTVVQIFSKVLIFDWLEPYKTPDQVAFVGSGFFISGDGHILTNFHLVSQAVALSIQVPSLGKEQIDAHILGVYPEMDLALLSLRPEGLEKLKAALGDLRFLPLGDSDSVVRSQEVLALGYPLGQEGLKSTEGIVSGREKMRFASYLQITAPLNPGNSGGPCLNHSGEVIGINFAGVLEAQNVGYVIPINEVKIALHSFEKSSFLRKPYLGGVFSAATDDMVRYLGNPRGGGFYIAEVFQGSLLEKAGVCCGDMVYEINGYRVDMYGEISVPWSEDKISIFDLMNRAVVGERLKFLLYRRGEKKEVEIELVLSAQLPVKLVYPQYEEVEYEVIGGMVIMQLTLNHVDIFSQLNPLFFEYHKLANQGRGRVVLTHLFPNSQAAYTRCMEPGNIIEEVNGVPIETLEGFRDAFLKEKASGYVTMKLDNKCFVVLSLSKIMADEPDLMAFYFYNPSSLLERLVR
jgi:S1-C subfamily serine protease